MRKFALVSRFALAVLTGAVASATVAAPTPVLAQGAKKPTAADKKAAKAAFNAGAAAFDAGDFEKAADEFKKANDLAPHPVPEFRAAEALDRAGKVLEAIAAYEALLNNPDKDKAGEERLGTAKKRIEELKKTPGEVSVVSTPAGAAVTVDGEPKPGETPMALKLAPGKHSITVVAEGYESMTVEVDVTTAGKSEQKLELVAKPPPEPEPEPVTAPPPPPPEPPKEEKEERSMLPAYITLGLAGVGAVVGTIFGVQALGSKSDFDDKPTNKSADDVERNALIADMAFGVALTLGVTGIVLLTADDGDDAAADSAKTRRRTQQAKRPRLIVAPYATPKGGGAGARFVF